MVETAALVREQLNNNGEKASLINARFLHPFDRQLICEIAQKHKFLVTLEDGIYTGGFGQQVEAFVKEKDLKLKVLCIAVPDIFVAHGDVNTLKKHLGMDADGIYKRIKEFIK